MAAVVLLFASLECRADGEVAGMLIVDPNGGGDVTTIQAAIDAACSGDAIFVTPGVYKERLIITNKSLRFLTGMPGSGQSKGQVIVDGSCNSSATVVASSDFALENVSFDGFIFRDGNGGAFEIFDIELVLEDCELVNNIAIFDGGAIFQVGGRLVMIRGVVEDNMTMQGGGASLSFDAEQEFIETIIRNNNAAGSGGAISTLASGGTASVCLTNSFVTGNSSGENGAIFAVGANVTITGGQIENNMSANIGGGMATAACPNVTINDCVCSNNVCSGPGGGMFHQDCNVNLNNCNCSNNTSMNGSGGGIYCIGGTCQCTDCTISDNYAGMNGGGCQLVDLAAGSQKIMNCCFENNEAVLNAGGLACIQSDAAIVELILSKVLGNCAGANAGGVLIEDAQLKVANTRIMSNAAVENGGGLLANVGADVTCNQCVLDANSANVGGGIFVEMSELMVCNSNIVSNTASQVASAFAAAPGADVGIENSIIFFHGGNFPIFESDSQSIDAQYSIVEGGFAGMEIMDMEPHFINELGNDGIPGTGDEDFYLGPNSNAIDAGLNELVPVDIHDLDWDGDLQELTPLDYQLNNRFASGRSSGGSSSFGGPIVDIGAIEFQGILMLGDINLDGVINLLDIEPFVDLLNRGGFQAEADVNQDGVVNLLDVQPFIDLLNS